jgi:hypothetical protein
MRSAMSLRVWMRAARCRRPVRHLQWARQPERMARQPRVVLPAKAGLWDAAMGSAHRRRAVTLVLTFTLTFASSFAYLYRQQRAEEPRAATAQPSMLPRVAPPPPANPAPRIVEPAPVAKATMPPPPAKSIVQPAPPSRDPNEEADEAPPAPVPVAVVLYHDRREAGRIEGSVSSMSQKPLTLTLISRGRNDNETGRTMVALDAWEKKAVGSSAGMELRQGDHVVVQSEGYQDLDKTVP